MIALVPSPKGRDVCGAAQAPGNVELSNEGVGLVEGTGKRGKASQSDVQSGILISLWTTTDASSGPSAVLQ